MEDVELSTEAIGGTSCAPEGCAGSSQYNEYMNDITNNLEASVIKPATVTGKEKLDMSILCEDTVGGIKSHNNGMVVPGSQCSHHDNDGVNELDSIPHSSSGKFNQQNCVVPNSDSGFVDQSSVASASNPDIKAFSGTLTSPGQGCGGGGGGSTPASPAARTPFHTGAITSNKGSPASAGSGMDGTHRYCTTETDKILELAPVTSGRILHHSGSSNTSPSDSSPSESQHQRSPSQQGWFAPPSPSIAPVLPSDSTVTTVTSSCHHQDNTQCHITGAVSMATRTKNTMFTMEVAGAGTGTSERGVKGEEVHTGEAAKSLSSAAVTPEDLHLQVLQPEQEEEKPVPPPRVSSVRGSSNRRSKLQLPSLDNQYPAGTSCSSSRHGDQTHSLSYSATSKANTQFTPYMAEGLHHHCNSSNTKSSNSIQGQKTAPSGSNHTDVHAQGHISCASNHCISAHSIQTCSADSIMSIERQSTSAVTRCANPTSCMRTAEQKPEQLQARLHGLSSSMPASTSSISHHYNFKAQSAVYTSSSLPTSDSSKINVTNLSSPHDYNHCNCNGSSINGHQKHYGHTHGATGDKYIKKQYHSSSHSSSRKQTHKSSAQNVSISGPNNNSQKDDFFSRHIHMSENNIDISASSQNPQSSIETSCTHRNTPHSNRGEYSNHGNSANKPLSAIPGRVSRLHHEMEQKKYGSFSSGSSSCSSGSSTHSNSSPEKEPEERGLFSPSYPFKDPPASEIPKRTFLKDSGLPSYNNTKGATPAIPRDMSHSHPAATSNVSRIRPTSASSSSNSAAKGSKQNMTQVSRSAPGSPTRAVTGSPSRGVIPRSTRGSHLAHPRTRIPSGGHKLPGTPADGPSLQHGDSRNSSLKSNSSTTGGHKRSKLLATKNTQGNFIYS